VHDDETDGEEAEEEEEEEEEEEMEMEKEEEKEEEGEEEEGEEEEESDLEDVEPPVRPQLPPPETGTTLFIRNIPFSATEDELRTLYAFISPFPLFLNLSSSFRAYGPLRYVRITMDTETGRSRGTGFACFWNKEHADKVIEQSELLRMEALGGNTVY
jgi:nucleolar protein 4